VGSLWRHADFRRLWVATTVSQLGGQVTELALPLLAISVLGATTLQVGLLSAAEYLPLLLFGLPAGAIVDRMRRRRVLLAGDLGRAVVLGSIPLAAAFGLLHLWPAGRRERQLQASTQGAAVLGPQLAGVLVAALRAPFAIALDALSFLGSAAFVRAIRRVEPAAPTVHKRQSIRRDAAEGLRYVLGTPVLRAIAVTAGCCLLFGRMVAVLLLVYLVREVRLGPAAIGLVFSLGSLGFFAGALSGKAIAARLGVGPTMVAATAVFGTGPLLLVVASRTTAPGLAAGLAVGALVLLGFGALVYNVTSAGLRQAYTPHGLQGRVTATIRLIAWGVTPVGAVAGGWLGGVLGLRPAIAVGALGCLLANVPLVASPIRRIRQLAEPAVAAG
jgi:MFS family permease